MPRAGDAIPSNTYAVWIAHRVPCRLLTAIPAKTRESQQAQHAEATLAASHHPHARDSLFRGLGTKAAIETEFVRKRSGHIILQLFYSRGNHACNGTGAKGNFVRRSVTHVGSEARGSGLIGACVRSSKSVHIGVQLLAVNN